MYGHSVGYRPRYGGALTCNLQPANGKGMTITITARIDTEVHIRFHALAAEVQVPISALYNLAARYMLANMDLTKLPEWAAAKPRDGRSTRRAKESEFRVLAGIKYMTDAGQEANMTTISRASGIGIQRVANTLAALAKAGRVVTDSGGSWSLVK